MSIKPTPNTPTILGPNQAPVQDTDLEAAILGAILAEPIHFAIAKRYLKSAEVFYKTEHQDVWRAMEALADQQILPALRDVSLKLREQRAQVTLPFLMELSDRAGLDINFEQRCILVYDFYHRRSVYTAAVLLARDAFDLSVDSLQASGAFRTRLDGLEAGLPDRKAKDLTAIAQEIIDDMTAETSPMVRSGIRLYDEVIGGYEPGCFYILAARPSMGKSAFVCQNLDGIAIQQSCPTGLLLLEGSAKSILRRLATRYSGFTADDMKQKRADPGLVRKALDRVTGAPLYIDDSPCQLDRLESRIVRLVLMGAKIVFVDYLQRIRDHRPKANPMDTVTAISGRMKDLAGQLNVPIVALSQLNRSCESRSGWDKRPVMSDLRASGDLEQDADMIAFLFRPEYYGLAEYPDGGFSTANLTEVHIAKNRESAVRTGDDAVMLYHRLAQSAYYSTKGEYDNSSYVLLKPF